MKGKELRRSGDRAGTVQDVNKGQIPQDGKAASSPAREKSMGIANRAGKKPGARGNPEKNPSKGNK